MRTPTNSPRRRDGKWYTRVVWWDQHDCRREITRLARSKLDAKRQGEKIIADMVQHGTEVLRPAIRTFAELTEYYQDKFAGPPEYQDGRKIRGSKDYKTIPYRLAQLREYFGGRELRSITHADLVQFRLQRLGTPTRHGTPRKIATVNRELALLHRLFTVAAQNRWVPISPFHEGESLMDASAETKRQTIPTDADFARLLAACCDGRAHIKPIVLLLADSGCRLGEALSLEWTDVDLGKGFLTLKSQNTKTEQQRTVVLSPRAVAALSELKGKGEDRLVFSGIRSIKGAWKKACEIAGIEGLRIHDLRHYHATRLVAAGVPLTVVARQLGHATPTTTYRYVNQSSEALEQLREVQEQIGRARLAPLPGFGSKTQ